MPKISALTTKATPATTDELPIVDNAGTPATKKATLGSLPVSTPQSDAINSAVTAHNADEEAHGQTAVGRAVLTAVTQADARAAIDAASQEDLDSKAPLDSPSFTGTVTAPTVQTGVVNDSSGVQAFSPDTRMLFTEDGTLVAQWFGSSSSSEFVFGGPNAKTSVFGIASLPATTSIGNVSSTELGYLDGVTSAIQTQLNAKAPLDSPTFTGTVTADSFSGDGSALTGLTKTQVGLGDVDNTSDATKNAAVAALTNKDLTSATNTYRGATDAQAGAVELATRAERILGLDTTRVLTVAAIKANWQGDFRWDFLRNATVANGSGGNAALVTNGAHSGSAQTGATAGAFTIYNAVMPRGVGFSPSNPNIPNWAAPIGVQVELNPISTTASGYIRFMFGGAGSGSATPITLGRNGIGFEVRDLRLWLLCHNGSVFTEQDTGVDLTSPNAAYAVFIYSNGAGNVSIYVDGVQAGTTATGGPTTITTTSNVMHLIQSNESDAASVRWVVNSPIKIIFGL